MADENPAGATPPSQTAGGAPAPAASPPAADAPKPDAAPAPAPAADKPHTETPTLLEGVEAPGKKADPEQPGEKPAEKPADAEQAEKPAEAKPADKPAEAKPGEQPQPDAKPADAPPVYEFKLPDGIKGEEATMGELRTMFGEAKVPPELAQKIVDTGTKAMLAYRDQLHADQHRIFADTRANWRNEVLADAELGGAGHKTAMGAIARMRDLFVPQADQKAFNDFLRVTGAGDHPAFLRMMHRAAQLFDEPPMPPAGAKPAPQPKRKGLRAIYAETKAAQGRS